MNHRMRPATIVCLVLTLHGVCVNVGSCQEPNTTEEISPYLQVESGGQAGICRWLGFTNDGMQLISAGDDKVIRIWDVRNPRVPVLQRTIRMEIGFGSHGMIYACALSPKRTADGRLLLAVGGFFAPEKEDRALENENDEDDCDYDCEDCEDDCEDDWDCDCDEECDDEEDSDDDSSDDPGDEQVMFEVDLQEFIGQVRLIDVDSGENVGLLDGHDGPVQSLTFSSDGRSLASGSTGSLGLENPEREIFVWDLNPLVSSAAPSPDWLDEVDGSLLDHDHKEKITSLAFVPRLNSWVNERLVSGSQDGYVTFWERDSDGDWGSLANKSRWVEKGYSVASIACAPDGRCVAVAFAKPLVDSSNSGGMLNLYDPDGKYLDSPVDNDEGGAIRIAFSPDGKQLLAGESPETWECQIVSVADGEEIVQFNEHDNEISAVAFAPRRRDGQAIVATAGGDNHGIRLWDPDSGDELGQIVGKGRTIQALAFSPEGSRLAFGNTYDYDEEDYPLQLTFDLTQMQPGLSAESEEPENGWIESFQKYRGLSADISEEDNQVLEFHDRNGEWLEDKDIDVWIAGDDQTLEDEEINCWSFVPDSDHIIIGTNVGLYLYDSRTGKEYDNLVGHVGSVNAVAVSSDGKMLASGGDDQTIRLWNIDVENDDVEMLLTIWYGEDGEWVVWNEEGYYMSSPAGDELVGWHLNQGDDREAKFYTAAQFRALYDRPQLVKLIFNLRGVDEALEEFNRIAVNRPKEVRVPLSRSLGAGPPEIKILAPIPGATFETNKTKLKFSVELPQKTIDNQKNLYLYVKLDSQPIADWHERLFRIQDLDFVGGKVEIEVPIELKPGKQRISVMADTENKTFSESKFVDLVSNVPMDPAAEKPKLLVLAVGVSEYAASAQVNQLKFADDDARGLAAEFKKQEGLAYSQVHVKIIPDREATQKGVKIGFEWLQQKAQDVGENLVVCVLVAGHGQDDDGQYYFVPHDFDGSHTAQVSGLGWKEFLLGPLRDIDAPVILLMDTCHSAAVTGMNQTIKYAVDPRYPLYVLMSSLAEQESFEDAAWNHGAFTLAVLEGLSGQKRQVATLADDGQGRGGRRLRVKSKRAALLPVPQPDSNANGQIELRELQNYVIARVYELTDGRQQPKAYPRQLPNNLSLSIVR